MATILLLMWEKEQCGCRVVSLNFPSVPGEGGMREGMPAACSPIPWRGDRLGKPWGWGTGCPLLDVCADHCMQLLIWVTHRSGARCVGIASAVYHCSPRSVPGWVPHGEPRQRNFFLYTVGVNQHFGKCNYRFTSCGNLWVSHTWSAWSSSMAQLFH